MHGRHWITGEWLVRRTNARQRRTIHYWLTVLWITIGSIAWLLLRDALWFVGFMSLYAIWISHLTGWAAETPVEREGEETSDTAEELIVLDRVAADAAAVSAARDLG